jgi:uncharacterized membrane protein YqgA involved in biofilm formation
MLTGTILNALGILIGGVMGLALSRQFAPPTQLAARGLMGVFTVFIGLRLTWMSFHGSLLQILKQLVVLILALVVGRLAGRLARLQKTSNPLGIVGAIMDGLMGYWQPLAVKMAMDGLATMGFVCAFGWGTMLAALPVFVFQGTLTLGAHYLEPFLRAHGLLDSISGIGGLLVFCVALVLLEIKKVELAAYLPSLVAAPLITWLWR